MKIIVCKDYEALSAKAAQIIGDLVRRKPDAVLGLATGNSPIGVYRYLVAAYERGELDFSRVSTYNLDEYLPIDPADENSYAAFMHQHLWDKVNVDIANCHIPNGNISMEEAPAVCEAYDNAVRAAGGIDLQLLGIGRNGHIGFNEPGEHFIYGCHKVALSGSTIAANQRFFASEADVPRYAVSLGVGSIMQARQVLLIATGQQTAEAVRRALEGDVSPLWQASILRTHPDAIFLLDEAAASSLSRG